MPSTHDLRPILYSAESPQPRPLIRCGFSATSHWPVSCLMYKIFLLPSVSVSFWSALRHRVLIFLCIVENFPSFPFCITVSPLAHPSICSLYIRHVDEIPFSNEFKKYVKSEKPDLKRLGIAHGGCFPALTTLLFCVLLCVSYELELSLDSTYSLKTPGSM
jgi:hypothetical protein